MLSWSNLLYLFVQSSNIVVVFSWTLVHFHCLHTRVIPSHTTQYKHNSNNSVAAPHFPWHFFQICFFYSNTDPSYPLLQVHYIHILSTSHLDRPILSPPTIPNQHSVTHSAGSLSKMRYESLLTPTRSPGFNWSASTNPMTGRK